MSTDRSGQVTQMKVFDVCLNQSIYIYKVLFIPNVTQRDLQIKAIITIVTKMSIA